MWRSGELFRRKKTDRGCVGPVRRERENNQLNSRRTQTVKMLQLRGAFFFFMLPLRGAFFIRVSRWGAVAGEEDLMKSRRGGHDSVLKIDPHDGRGCVFDDGGAWELCVFSMTETTMMDGGAWELL